MVGIDDTGTNAIPIKLSISAWRRRCGYEREKDSATVLVATAESRQRQRCSEAGVQVAQSFAAQVPERSQNGRLVDGKKIDANHQRLGA